MSNEEILEYLKKIDLTYDTTSTRTAILGLIAKLSENEDETSNS